MTSRSRRRLLLSIPALAAPRLFAQTARPSIRVRGINHVTLAVSDVARSVEFYQGLFGMPVVSRQGTTTNLQIGTGPQFLRVSAAGGNKPRIDSLCLGVENFDGDAVARILAQHGVSRTDSNAPLTMQVRMRGATREIDLRDPSGFLIQLQDWRYCGGGGALGNLCPAPEPPRTPGLLAVRGWSHCTNAVSNPAASRAFFQDAFGLRIQAYQGQAAPVYGIGGGVEFLMFTGNGSGIHHPCMTLGGFRPETVVAALEKYGITPRTGQGTPGPLMHYITRRGPDRGGAAEGTPELYFTDPDGLLMQLQDVSYCGGSGVLGDVCL
jgi:catechol 2,3-dioxygenase-like lactoylglutathione lyase family enzyme